MIQNLLLKAISHERMRQKLHDLNCYFYNRKHETQIRDELVLIINKISKLTAISEHPKCMRGAVDLSIYDPSIPVAENGGGIATIELKHHYPKDLLLWPVKRDIASDISRGVVSPTTHFIHIVQQRTLVDTPSFGRVKFLERDADDISFYVGNLEKMSAFPRHFRKESVCIEVQCKLKSKYTFNVYSFEK
ncbi:hypothetical protein H5A34_10120 [Pectobacterium brasiliense]|uniref:hypothetical protein n=1 Tax=Pectobacterium brasiliense TaxID=180957 RepID=UPI0019698F7A|nr:hypothetical protein [Pectobacterium brasiliense]MBN3068619.1 hypothetical protein [Pectobacterium brasiliense]MBN3246517.1 hypothetical protein [Pectobacterium brasiliense]